MIITVSGPHGTGKSTYAVHLARELGLRHISAGLLFRKLAKERHVSLEEFGQLALKDPSIDRLVDEETMKEAEKGGVVVDGQLSGWVLKEIADMRIYLTAPDNVRLERIAERDNITAGEARKQTFHRESVQSERYRKHYGFKVEDWSIYHLVVDTSLVPKEDTAKILLTAALAVKARKTGRDSKKP
ncbi:MAG TPA: AAA family ATPase [Candidatus Bathyarchaeia archaeon]